MDFDKHIEPWKQSKHLFHEYLNMEEYGFELDSELILVDMHGLSYFKIIDGNEFQILIGFHQDTSLVHSFKCRVRIQEIENNINYVLNKFSNDIDPHEITVGATIFHPFRELREKFIRVSKEEINKQEDYKIALKNTAEIIRKDCGDIVIPALKEWIDIEKIYNEVVIPICQEGKKVFGINDYSDIIGGSAFANLKVMYILNKFSDPFLIQFIKNRIVILKEAKEHYWYQDNPEDYKKIIKEFILYVNYLGIDYDFSEFENQL